MADVIHVPSIWDYIAQAGNQGIQSYEQAKQYTDQKQAQEAGLLGQMFSQGAVDNTVVNNNPYFKQRGITVQPNKPQMQRTIAASPDVNPATGKPWSDEERESAGFDPAWKKTVDQATVSNAQTTLEVNKIRQKYAAGGQLTDAEARLAGLPTGEDLFASADKTLTAVGSKYADAAIAPLMEANGGRVPDRGWEVAMDNAAKAYNADRQAHGLPPDPSARNYFASQILNRVVEQRKQEIQNRMAMAAIDRANRPVSALSPEDRKFQLLTQVIDSRVRELDALQGSDKFLSLKLTDPTKANDPSVIRYNALVKSINAARNAQARIAGGIGGDLGVDETGAPTGTVPPPQGGGSVGIVQNARPTLRQSVVDGAIAMIKNGQAQLGSVDTSPTLTPAEKQAVKAAFKGGTK